VNAAYLGEYLDRDSAMARVEANIESNMQTVLNDWGLYQAAKGYFQHGDCRMQIFWLVE
jgi:hypothetical protein